MSTDVIPLTAFDTDWEALYQYYISMEEVEDYQEEYLKLIPVLIDGYNLEYLM